MFACPHCAKARSFASYGALLQHSKAQHGGVHISHPKLVVAYEDDWLAVVVKPQHMPTVGTDSLHRSDMLLGLRPSRFANQTGEAESKDALQDGDKVLNKARPVHRLDSETGGLVMFGKTKGALAALAQMFADHTIRKRYRAIVAGDIELAEGQICFPVDSKPAITKYARVSSSPSPRFGKITKVDLWPQTGRKHQLRRHLAEVLDRPIVGDVRYGRRGSGKANLMYLWALQLEFVHPFIPDFKCCVEIPEPESFEELVATERGEWEVQVGLESATSSANDAAGTKSNEIE
eukprot:c601_g1_i1.p1 GENE.c601_g1_i1~~c601_g1_i1.p1  ORF type:complete len:291 (+),score=46.84 c601_g1_i1:36-908(+)